MLIIVVGLPTIGIGAAAGQSPDAFYRRLRELGPALGRAVARPPAASARGRFGQDPPGLGMR